MSIQNRWLLPEGIEETLPDESRRIETVRRALLDLLAGWGYELVMPPMIEYLEALLTGVGEDLSLLTFKLTDPFTGRLLGVRPDMTPQAARIDAHYLKRKVPARLCYVGPVIRTKPDGFGGTREALQVGAEVFGHTGIESDIEILTLMLKTLSLIGFDEVHVDIGHVNVFRGLAEAAKLAPEHEKKLFDVVQRKARPEMQSYLKKCGVDTKSKKLFDILLEQNGELDEFDKSIQALKEGNNTVQEALNNLQLAIHALKQNMPNIKFYYDLAEISGYQYYTGMVFSAFIPGQGQAVAKGGRYDGIGKAFGRARSATGFSADLRRLIKLAQYNPQEPKRIFAPHPDDKALQAKIDKLRN